VERLKLAMTAFHLKKKYFNANEIFVKGKRNFFT